MSEHDHLGELKLRRLLAGELPGSEAPAVESCPSCRTRLRALEEEQRRFEEEIPFERFAAGVERAARAPRGTGVPGWRRLGPLAALAATLVVLVGARVLLEPREPSNRLKGGAQIEVRVAGAQGGPQRQASADPAVPEPLSPGERLALGYRPEGHRFVAALSLDAGGEVTALYPETGRSLPVPSGSGTHYLPDSLVLTGRGLERVIVVLSDEPLGVEALGRAAREAYRRAGGDLTKLERIEAPGEQFHRTFLKP